MLAEKIIIKEVRKILLIILFAFQIFVEIEIPKSCLIHVRTTAKSCRAV